MSLKVVPKPLENTVSPVDLSYSDLSSLIGDVKGAAQEAFLQLQTTCRIAAHKNGLLQAELITASGRAEGQKIAQAGEIQALRNTIQTQETQIPSQAAEIQSANQQIQALTRQIQAIQFRYYFVCWCIKRGDNRIY